MGMEKITFTRQNEDSENLSANNFTVHVYPFNTLPVLVSHIQPKFVIMATTRAVSNLEGDATRALIRQIPTLETILRLSSAWTNFIPDHAKEDRSYWPPYDPGPTDDTGGEGNGGGDDDDDDQDKVTERSFGLKEAKNCGPYWKFPQNSWCRKTTCANGYR
jgi:hypothetical protein